MSLLPSVLPNLRQAHRAAGHPAPSRPAICRAVARAGGTGGHRRGMESAGRRDCAPHAVQLVNLYHSVVATLCAPPADAVS